MFCPSCSREQLSQKTKFCANCGFDLELVSEIVVYQGKLPSLTKLEKSKEKLAKRLNILFGLSVWLVVSFLFNIISIIGSPSADGITVASIGFLVGLFIMILSAPSLKELIAKSQTEKPSLLEQETPRSFKTKKMSDALQLLKFSPRNYIAPDGNLKVNTTNELIQLPSVVEETTKFLKKD